MSTFSQYSSFEAVGNLSVTRFKFLVAWVRWKWKEAK